MPGVPWQNDTVRTQDTDPFGLQRLAAPMLTANPALRAPVGVDPTASLYSHNMTRQLMADMNQRHINQILTQSSGQVKQIWEEQGLEKFTGYSAKEARDLFNRAGKLPTAQSALRVLSQTEGAQTAFGGDIMNAGMVGVRNRHALANPLGAAPMMDEQAVGAIGIGFEQTLLSRKRNGVKPNLAFTQGFRDQDVDMAFNEAIRGGAFRGAGQKASEAIDTSGASMMRGMRAMADMTQSGTMEETIGKLNTLTQGRWTKMVDTGQLEEALKNISAIAKTVSDSEPAFVEAVTEMQSAMQAAQGISPEMARMGAVAIGGTLGSSTMAVQMAGNMANTGYVSRDKAMGLVGGALAAGANSGRGKEATMVEYLKTIGSVSAKDADEYHNAMRFDDRKKASRLANRMFEVNVAGGVRGAEKMMDDSVAMSMMKNSLSAEATQRVTSSILNAAANEPRERLIERMQSASSMETRDILRMTGGVGKLSDADRGKTTMSSIHEGLAGTGMEGQGRALQELYDKTLNKKGGSHRGAMAAVNRMLKQDFMGKVREKVDPMVARNIQTAEASGLDGEDAKQAANFLGQLDAARPYLSAKDVGDMRRQYLKGDRDGAFKKFGEATSGLGTDTKATIKEAGQYRYDTVAGRVAGQQGRAAAVRAMPAAVRAMPAAGEPMPQQIGAASLRNLGQALSDFGSGGNMTSAGIEDMLKNNPNLRQLVSEKDRSEILKSLGKPGEMAKWGKKFEGKASQMELGIIGAASGMGAPDIFDYETAWRLGQRGATSGVSAEYEKQKYDEVMAASLQSGENLPWGSKVVAGLGGPREAPSPAFKEGSVAVVKDPKSGAAGTSQDKSGGRISGVLTLLGGNKAQLDGAIIDEATARKKAMEF